MKCIVAGCKKVATHFYTPLQEHRTVVFVLTCNRHVPAYDWRMFREVSKEHYLIHVVMNQ
jgi:hypothetical protein